MYIILSLSLDRNGLTVLHRTAAKGNLEMAQLLLQYGADPTLLVNLISSLPTFIHFDCPETYP